jgi:hypothetical protein
MIVWDVTQKIYWEKDESKKKKADLTSGVSYK